MEYKFPNRPVMPVNAITFDDRTLYEIRSAWKAMPYAAKCKRRRTGEPTPCYCCPEECVGEPAMTPPPQRDCKWAWLSTGFCVLGIIAICLKGVAW